MGPKTLMLVAFFALVSCVGPVDQPADLRGDATSPPSSAPSAPLAADQISFQMVKEKVLVNKCLGCHSDADASQGALSFETYKVVFQNKALLLDRILSGSMPQTPVAPLTSAEKDLIVQWLKNGAREFAAPRITNL